MLELLHDAPLLELVHLPHRLQEQERVARVAGELLQRGDVLREAAAAEADPGAQEVRPEPVVEPDAARHLDDVGADELADVRDLVDEADARREEGVRRELDELGRRDVHAEELGLDPVVQLDDALGVRRLEGADDDAVGVHEVRDRGSLGRELGIRDVADVRRGRARRAARARARPSRRARCSSSRASGRPATPSGISSTTVQTAREVGVARVGRRRPDGDVEEVGAGDRLRARRA